MVEDSPNQPELWNSELRRFLERSLNVETRRSAKTENGEPANAGKAKFEPDVGHRMPDAISSAAVPLPQSEPRIVRIHRVVALVRRFAVRGLQRPGIAERKDLLQSLDIRDCLLDVHRKKGLMQPTPCTDDMKRSS